MNKTCILNFLNEFRELFDQDNMYLKLVKECTGEYGTNPKFPDWNWRNLYLNEKRLFFNLFHKSLFFYHNSHF